LKNISGSYTKGLDEIIQLRPIRFHYKPDNPKGYSSEPEELGFVAQEVQKVFPEAVSEGADGYLDLNLHAVNVATVNAIRELNELVRKQNAIIAQQNERIRILEESLAGTTPGAESALMPKSN
jgi:hypothetical protein